MIGVMPRDHLGALQRIRERLQERVLPLVRDLERSQSRPLELLELGELAHHLDDRNDPPTGDPP